MIDLKQTSGGDLDLGTGDIVMVEPTERHKADILLTSQGDFAESPLTGVGIIDYINAEDGGDMLRQISQQMQRDGIKITKVGFDTDGQLIVDGSYENDKNRA